MLCVSDSGWKALLRLGEELAWLEREHPEKTELIALARRKLDSIQLAGSYGLAALNTETPQCVS